MPQLIVLTPFSLVARVLTFESHLYLLRIKYGDHLGNRGETKVTNLRSFHPENHEHGVTETPTHEPVNNIYLELY